MGLSYYLVVILLLIIVLIVLSVVLTHRSDCSHSDYHGLTGKVVVPGDRGYKRARTNWNPFPALFPKIIVFAQNDQDVMNAVVWARKNNVPFRIRSGRHGLTNWSLIDKGLVIDVSDMNQIDIDEEKGIVIVGPGATVGDTDEKLLSKGYVLPFGDSGAV